MIGLAHLRHCHSDPPTRLLGLIAPDVPAYRINRRGAVCFIEDKGSEESEKPSVGRRCSFRRITLFERGGFRLGGRRDMGRIRSR